MTSLTIELLEIPTIQDVIITDDTLSVDLSDGRTISVPLAWYPRFLNASYTERNDWRTISQGEGIHWTQLDEDGNVSHLLEDIVTWIRISSPDLTGRQKMWEVCVDGTLNI